MKALSTAFWLISLPFRAIAFGLFACGVLAMTLICLAFSTCEERGAFK